LKTETVFDCFFLVRVRRLISAFCELAKGGGAIGAPNHSDMDSAQPQSWKNLLQEHFQVRYSRCAFA
jgi:hypothetical protein